MYNNEKIGVGILTCNRRELFERLYRQITSIDYIDYIVVVKNKDFDYGDILKNVPAKVEYVNILEDINVAYYKNQILHRLMDKNCEHLFVLEDDMGIKDPEVFKTYIDTAKLFNLQHLNWNTLPVLDKNTKYVVTQTDKNNNVVGLDITLRLCGCFSYFTRYAIEFGGYLNYKLYNNALEHIEHCYRLSLLRLTTPFYSFADIHDGQKYLENFGEKATIDTTTDEYLNRRYQAYSNFKNTYGIQLNKIHICSVDEVKKFLAENLKNVI